MSVIFLTKLEQSFLTPSLVEHSLLRERLIRAGHDMTSFHEALEGVCRMVDWRILQLLTHMEKAIIAEAVNMAKPDTKLRQTIANRFADRLSKELGVRVLRPGIDALPPLY